MIWSKKTTLANSLDLEILYASRGSWVNLYITLHWDQILSFDEKRNPEGKRVLLLTRSPEHGTCNVHIVYIMAIMKMRVKIIWFHVF